MNSAINNFQDSLKELKLLLSHFEALEEPLVDDNPLIIAATSKSVVVLSCGYFENYLKAAFMEYIDAINKFNFPSKYIRDKIWSTHKNKTLDVLKFLKNKNESEYIEILTIYATSFENDEKKNKPLLVKESFAITKSNPKQETINILFKGIGIDLFKRSLFLNSFRNIELFKLTLDGLIDLRNSYAHGNRGITTSSLTEVEEYIIFLEKTALVFNKILEDDLNKIELVYYSDCFNIFHANYKSIE